MKEKIKIYDTTLRDGAQSVGVTFSLEDKLRITGILDDAGFHYIEGGWPGSNPKDIAFFKEAKKLKLKNALLCAFSSTKFKGTAVNEDQNLLQLIASETPGATIFGKSWDFHVLKALNISLEENLELISRTLTYIRSYFDQVIYDAEHFFDGYKNNPEYALKTLCAAQEAGVDWIVLCDTNGGTLTGECSGIIERVKQVVSIPLGIHTHNDSELAVANSLAAVQTGIRMVQGTINGLGERCGNANLCSIIPCLSLKQEYRTVSLEQIQRLTYLSRLVSEVCNQPAPVSLPFVGEHAFAHKGGIHVSAVNKDPATYEHISPDLVGNHRHVSISELSGKSNVISKTVEMGICVDKESASVQKILKQVKEMESRGYHFEDAEASFELMSQSLLGKVQHFFTLYGYRVIVWKNAGGSAWSEATIKAGVPRPGLGGTGNNELETVEHTSADANGPVEALDKAIRKVLEKFYPELKDVKLMDYKVRILNEADGTAAVTRVLIHSADKERKWGTVGVSDNIIDASWQALTDSLVYKLYKDRVEKEAAA